MIEHIARKVIRHVVNRTPFFGAIVSRTRVPVVRSIYVDLPSNVAKSHPAPRNDGDGIQVVVDAVEVPVHLSIRTTERCKVIGQTGPLDSCRVFTWESNQFAHAGFPTLGVPYVTPFTATELGRFKCRWRVSSSAIAPPSEFPT